MQRDKHNIYRPSLVVTFHPGLPDITAKLRELHSVLTVDPKLSTVFDLPPRVSFRRPSNLCDKLVRARFSHSVVLNSCGPCNGNTRCQLCAFLPHQVSITSYSGVVFQLKCGRYADCNSKYVVYCITCKICRFQYVGCTNNFRLRANQHKSILSRRLRKSE